MLAKLYHVQLTYKDYKENWVFEALTTQPAVTGEPLVSSGINDHAQISPSRFNLTKLRKLNFILTPMP